MKRKGCCRDPTFLKKVKVMTKVNQNKFLILRAVTSKERVTDKLGDADLKETKYLNKRLKRPSVQ